MGFRRFEFTILLLVISIVGVSLLFAWSFYSNYLQFSKIYFAGIILLLTIFLFLIINRNQKKVFTFLENLKYEDSLSKLKVNKNRNNEQLQILINEIAEKFSNVKIDKESQHQYLLNTIKHLKTGILSFDSSGVVELVNDEFKKLFQVVDLKHIEELDGINQGLCQFICNIKPGKHQMLRIERNNNLLRLSASASEFYIKNRKVKLISFQDIRSELQQEEIEAQQKLIRVLTHEIMNSVSPITSLTSTLLEEIDEADKNSFMQNAKIGLSAINKRSEGLSKFVDVYKSISRLPDPKFEEIYLKDILGRILVLFKDEMQKENIDFSIELKDHSLKIIADEKMLEQVFINILRNAIEALKDMENKQVNVATFADFNDNVIIEIQNNGKTIPAEMIDKVFLPFFTTKENGTGIGLSLSRQIMHLHKGNIILKTEKKFTVFQLML